MPSCGEGEVAASAVVIRILVEYKAAVGRDPRRSGHDIASVPETKHLEDIDLTRQANELIYGFGLPLRRLGGLGFRCPLTLALPPHIDGHQLSCRAQVHRRTRGQLLELNALLQEVPEAISIFVRGIEVLATHLHDVAFPECVGTLRRQLSLSVIEVLVRDPECGTKRSNIC
ncbi:hypothetical protein D9M68_835600 [compost metagenome]